VTQHGDLPRSERVVGGGILDRIQRVVADHPVRLREMNTWAPQGS
jgi:hypothetical protein